MFNKIQYYLSIFKTYLILNPLIFISVIQITITFENDTELFYKIKDASEQILNSNNANYDYTKFLVDCQNRIEVHL
jgi:glutathione peroxidase-family protein